MGSYVGQGRAQNWLDSINQARTLPLATFLCALGVQDLGKSASQALAQHFLSLDAMRKAEAESIAALDNFGDLTAQHIMSGLKVRSALIDDLLGYIDVQDAEAPIVLADDAPFKNQSFVFTGTLVAMKRSEAQAKVQALGADTPSGVSAKLTYLVIGDSGKAGSKKTKAEKLGITILSETEFIELLHAPDDQAVNAGVAIKSENVTDVASEFASKRAIQKTQAESENQGEAETQLKAESDTQVSEQVQLKLFD